MQTPDARLTGPICMHEAVFLPVVCLDFDERLSVNPKKAAVRGRVYETVPARSVTRPSALQ
jgi:hypothetical protein